MPFLPSGKYLTMEEYARYLAMGGSPEGVTLSFEDKYPGVNQPSAEGAGGVPYFSGGAGRYPTATSPSQSFPLASSHGAENNFPLAPSHSNPLMFGIGDNEPTEDNYIRVSDPAALARIRSQAPSAIKPGGSLYRTMDDIQLDPDTELAMSLQSRIRQLADEIANSPMQRDTTDLQAQLNTLMKIYSQGNEEVYRRQDQEWEQTMRGYERDAYQKSPDIIEDKLRGSSYVRNEQKRVDQMRGLIAKQRSEVMKAIEKYNTKGVEAQQGLLGAAGNPYAALIQDREEVVKALNEAGQRLEMGDVDGAWAIYWNIKTKYLDPKPEGTGTETPPPAPSGPQGGGGGLRGAWDKL